MDDELNQILEEKLFIKKKIDNTHFKKEHEYKENINSFKNINKTFRHIPLREISGNVENRGKNINRNLESINIDNNPHIDHFQKISLGELYEKMDDVYKTKEEIKNGEFLKEDYNSVNNIKNFNDNFIENPKLHFTDEFGKRNINHMDSSIPKKQSYLINEECKQNIDDIDNSIDKNKLYFSYKINKQNIDYGKSHVINDVILRDKIKKENLDYSETEKSALVDDVILHDKIKKENLDYNETEESQFIDNAISSNNNNSMSTKNNNNIQKDNNSNVTLVNPSCVHENEKKNDKLGNSGINIIDKSNDIHNKEKAVTFKDEVKINLIKNINLNENKNIFNENYEAKDKIRSIEEEFAKLKAAHHETLKMKSKLYRFINSEIYRLENEYRSKILVLEKENIELKKKTKFLECKYEKYKEFITKNLLLFKKQVILEIKEYKKKYYKK